MNGHNTQVRMRRHPAGMVTREDFDIVEVPLPQLEDGQALVRKHGYLSLDQLKD